MIDALLPWPPGANNLYATARNSRRRFPTERYKDWIDEARFALFHVQQAAVQAIKGPVTVSIKLSAPTKCKYDVDGRVKAILDLLVGTELIEADSMDIVTKVTSEVGYGFTGAWVLVEPVWKEGAA